jgi:hypothetical protein
MYYINKIGQIFNSEMELVRQGDQYPEWQLYVQYLKNGGTLCKIEGGEIVPEIITRRQFKIALAVLGKNEQDILNGIDQLPEPNRPIARISYMEAGTFERYNPELIAVATNFLNMTEDDIDEVFKIGSNY